METGSGNVRCRRRHYHHVVGTYAPFQRYRIYSSGHRGPFLRGPAPRGRVRVSLSSPSRDDEFVRPMARVETRSNGLEPRGRLPRWEAASSSMELRKFDDFLAHVVREDRSALLSVERAREHRTTASLGISIAERGLSRQRGGMIRSYGLNCTCVMYPPAETREEKV